jgi:hypothetical protein
MNKGTKTTVGLAAVGFMAVFVSFTPKLSPEMERRLMAEHQQREAAKETAWEAEQEAKLPPPSPSQKTYFHLSRDFALEAR